MKKINKFFWCIFAIGIGLRLLLWTFQANAAGDDGERYYAESHNLVVHQTFSSNSVTNEGKPYATAHDLPLWPGTMAGILKVTGSKSATIRIAGLLNLALYAGAALLLASLLAVRPFNVGRLGQSIAIGLFLFIPESIPYSLFYMPDAMAVFWTVLALWAYFRALYNEKKFVWFVVSFFSFSLAILSKPISLPLTGAFVVITPFLMKRQWWVRVGTTVLFVVIVAGMLYPWVMRNKRAFGTAGLTTISGTNLYSCNWGWLVQQMPPKQKAKILEEDKAYESTLAGQDLMKRSQNLGAYARSKISEYWKEYALFTLKKHPKMYFGTGTIALFRYLGMDGACTALERQYGSGRFAKEATTMDKVFAYILQGAALLLLTLCYFLVAIGFSLAIGRTIKCMRNGKSIFSDPIIAVACAALILLMFAIVIGPVTATRYRFIMIPFFAVLASFIELKFTKQ